MDLSIIFTFIITASIIGLAWMIDRILFNRRLINSGNTSIILMDGKSYVIVPSSDYESLTSRLTDMENICAETYQIAGVLLDQTGQFNTHKGSALLDNLSTCTHIHKNLLPWD